MQFLLPHHTLSHKEMTVTINCSVFITQVQLLGQFKPTRAVRYYRVSIYLTTISCLFLSATVLY